ncbi:hypothetical protein G5I_04837 [Acromyrmex echinatior]|uniref:Uncharacterized protein n=1 Tax=Acromyrmex echinatior TaxID=103372 RepID=F4WGP7_ACREC|nr:hypothetical protein G5I_04837 [Acromyrmex echinatior]
MGGLLWIQTTLDSLPGLSVINVKEGGEVPEKRCDFYSRVKGVLALPSSIKRKKLNAWRRDGEGGFDRLSPPKQRRNRPAELGNRAPSPRLSASRRIFYKSAGQDPRSSNQTWDGWNQDRCRTRHGNRDEKGQIKDISSWEEAPSPFDHREEGHMRGSTVQVKTDRRTVVHCCRKERKEEDQGTRFSQRTGEYQKAILRREEDAYEKCHQAGGQSCFQGETLPDPAVENDDSDVNYATGSLSRIDDPSSRAYRFGEA